MSNVSKWLFIVAAICTIIGTIFLFIKWDKDSQVNNRNISFRKGDSATINQAGGDIATKHGDVKDTQGDNGIVVTGDGNTVNKYGVDVNKGKAFICKIEMNLENGNGTAIFPYLQRDGIRYATIIHLSITSDIAVKKLYLLFPTVESVIGEWSIHGNGATQFRSENIKDNGKLAGVLLKDISEGNFIYTIYSVDPIIDIRNAAKVLVNPNNKDFGFI